jgi:hypothetical protein
MKCFKTFIVLVFCACSLGLQAQKTYLWSAISDGALGTSHYEMHEIDFLNSTSQGMIFSIDLSRFEHPAITGFDTDINSFEFTQDRAAVYLIESEGDLFRYTIATDLLEYLGDVTPETTPIFVFNYTNIADITFVNDSTLYCGGFTHGTYNTNSGQFDKLREPTDLNIAFTLNEQEILYTRQSWHKDKFYYVAGPGANSLREADLSDPENNIELLDFDDFNVSASHFPIVSYQYDCDSTILFARVNQNGNGGNEFNGYWKVDLENSSLEFSHSPTIIPGGIIPRTTKHYNEPEWEDCQRRIDLDMDDSTIEGVDFLINDLCLLDNTPLSDVDLSVHNEYPIDSLVIEVITSGVSGEIIISAGNYTLINVTNKVVISNNGSTSLGDYRNAVLTGFFNNLDSNLEIEIEFTLWDNGKSGNPALATLRYLSPLPDAGSDEVNEACLGEFNLVLEDLIASDADADGLFYNSNFQNITDVPDYMSAISDTIFYIVGNGLCFDTAQLVNLIHPVPQVFEINDTILCAGEVLELDFSSHIEDILWEDGSDNRIRIISDSGSYSYELINSSSCISRDSFSVFIESDALISSIEAQECIGDIFFFLDNEYSIPGNYLDTIRTIRGCDSIIYDIDFENFDHEQIEFIGDLGFCNGGSTFLEVVTDFVTLELNGVESTSPIEITEENDYLIGIYDENGCYAEELVSIELYEDPSISVEDINNIIFEDDILLPVDYEGDIISYLWSPSENLDCSNCPFPSLITAENNVYMIEVLDVNGCTTTAQIYVSFEETKVYIPNIISQNPNQVDNGILFLQGEISGTYSLQVYDRWGNLLFDKEELEINNQNQGWRPGDVYNQGVYVYKVFYTVNGEEFILSGDITVL